MVRKEISLKWNCRYNHLYRIVQAFIFLLFLAVQPTQLVNAIDEGDIPLQARNAAPLFQDLLTLTISKDGTGSGVVTSDPVGIDCGTTCAFDFELNTLVTLSAVPDPGSIFTGWSDAGCPGTGTCQVTMDVAKGVTATFTAIEYTLTINSTHGTVTKNPDKTTYHYGEDVELTAAASTGWTFTNWTGDITSATNPTTVHIDGDKNVSANYTEITFTISGNAGVSGATISFTGGTPVTADGSGNYSITVPYNWTGTVTPSKAGYTFTPDHRNYTDVLADDPGEDYAATAITYTISGNAGVGGATISFTGGTPVTADGSGNYSITVPYNWTGTVTPSKAGYTFTPDQRNYTNVLADDPGEDYTATAITYTISGNAGVSGATISFTGGTPVIADGSGDYSITVPYNWSGTVTPSKAGYTFTPDQRNYTNVLADDPGEDYTATAITYTISGNAEVEGVTITFDGGTPVLTDSNGDYSITVPYNWTGTVTPSKAGYTFTPAYRNYEGVLADQTNQNFTTSSITFTISGNAGVSGATISFTGGTPVTANGSGDYSITVPYNWSGTVTPSKTGYTFTPDHRDYTNVLADDPGEDYTATAITYTISGNAGVGGATISFTGGAPVTADGSGNYSITVPYNWTGTVTPSKTEYTFTPNHYDYTNVMANQINQNYTATINKYLLTINKTGTGSGVVTSTPTGISCGSDCTENFDYGTIVTLNAIPASNYHRFLGWSGGGCSGTGSCQVTISAAATVTAEFEISTFEDVPFDHPRWAYIEALWDNGYTAGCQAAGAPLRFCPENTMLRAESSVFMLRAALGPIGTPVDAEPYVFGDDWTGLLWAQPWAEKMWDLGMTAGCQWPADSTPKLFCPYTDFTRDMGAVFGLRIKHGSSMEIPTGTGTVFADMTDPTYWGTGWAELAFSEGLIPACGTDEGSGKPLFCPQDFLDRSWSAYMIVQAKNLTLP
jgi:hypothetical protein